MNNETIYAIKNFSDYIRDYFSIPLPITDIDDLVRKLNGTIEDVELDVWKDGKLIVPNNKSSKYAFIIQVSPYQSKERRNFVVARELGHLFLRSNYLDAISTSPIRKFV